jgi:RNA polymerase sigma-70 factor (ECF subfamily)
LKLLGVDHKPEAEQDLVRHLRRGDPESWRRLCVDYGAPLFRYCYCWTGGSREAAEEVRQETLIAATAAISRYRGEVPLFAWLCGIARHKAADHLRRQPELHAQLDFPDLEKGTLASAAGSPEAAVMRLETRAAILETLWDLPADYRTALVWRYVDGEGVDAIAKKLGRTYKGAESLLSRARAAFARKFRKVDRSVEKPIAAR